MKTKTNKPTFDFEADGIHAGVAEFEWNGQMYRAIKDYDQTPENPWEAWDCEPPVVAVGGRDYSYRNGGADTPDIKLITNAQIIQHHKAIEQMVRDYWAEEEAADFNLLEYLLGNKTVEIGAFDLGVRELVSDSIDEYLSGGMDSEMLDRMEEVWSWAGVQTWRDTLVGYSQGDWVDTMFVATPEWLDRSGLTAGDLPPSETTINTYLENAAHLFHAYMFGDVYGVTVERLVSNGDDDAEWEEVESCWGFYGYDDERSGLASFVRDAVEYYDKILEAAA